jgi:hypothetical protein
MKVFWDKATERGTRLANPLLFSHSYFNTPISLCAIEFGLKGYHTTFCAGQQSGIEAVRAALGAIQLGHAQMMLCGGVEAWTPTRALLEADSNVVHSTGRSQRFSVLENARHAEQRNAANRIVLDPASNSMAATTIIRCMTLWDCGGAPAPFVATFIQEQHLQFTTTKHSSHFLNKTEANAI